VIAYDPTDDARVYLFDSHQEKFIDILQPFEQKSGETYIVRKIYALSKGVRKLVKWVLSDIVFCPTIQTLLSVKIHSSPSASCSILEIFLPGRLPISGV